MKLKLVTTVSQVFHIYMPQDEKGKRSSEKIDKF